LITAPPQTGFGHMTGFKTFSFMFTTAGTYVLGVGAMNAGDQSVVSGLLVDNFQFTDGSGGSGAFPGDPSAVPPETPTAPADQVFAAIGKPSGQGNASALDGVLAVNVLSKISSPPAETAWTGLDVLVSSPSGAHDSLYATT